METILEDIGHLTLPRKTVAATILATIGVVMTTTNVSAIAESQHKDGEQIVFNEHVYNIV